MGKRSKEICLPRLSINNYRKHQDLKALNQIISCYNIHGQQSEILVDVFRFENQNISIHIQHQLIQLIF